MDDRKISPKKASWELIDVEGTDKVNCSSATLKLRCFIFLSWEGYLVWLGRIFNIRPDIETIRIPDIRLIYNVGNPAGYPVICRISTVGQISGLILDIQH